MRLQVAMFDGQHRYLGALLAASTILGMSACNGSSNSSPAPTSSTPIIATPAPAPTQPTAPTRLPVQQQLTTVLRELGLPPKGSATPLPQSVETIGIGVAYPSGKKIRHPNFPAKGIAAQQSGAKARMQTSYGIGIVTVSIERLEQPLPAKLDYCDADWTRAPSFIEGSDLCSLERISPTAMVQTIDFDNLREMRLILPRTIITVSSGAENLKTPGAKPPLSKVAQRKLLLDPRWLI
ncbi:hypothetical protein ACFCV3_32070 [Kribbella sp. NPDC056345]|uniref:hypothetical protein n=1 Tax=Kribbella sp. NPDC056345 TaxID=3345789 RepID=UPI0035D8670E